MTENTFDRVYALVRLIPPGQTASYGQIARLLGNPKLSRVVGYAMNAAPPDVPCHRVVNRLGALSDAFQPGGRETHRLLLMAENIPFLENGCVDLSKCQWAGPDT